MSDVDEEQREAEGELNSIDTVTIFKYKEDSVTSKERVEEKCEGAPSILVIDEDNDLVLPRRRIIGSSLHIEHSSYTDVDSVGLQVWNGAILLAEFIIFKNYEFKKKHVFELGSGTGLVSIIAAKYCDTITCTDLNNDVILKTVERNFWNNRSQIQANYRVLPFNFSEDWSPAVEGAINEADIIIASELIYDNEVSENLVKTLVRILKDRKHITVYFSVERRYVFTRSNQRTEAVHYEYFFNLLNEFFQFSSTDYELNQIINIPQYFYEYERLKEIELWCICKNK